MIFLGLLCRAWSLSFSVDCGFHETFLVPQVKAHEMCTNLCRPPFFQLKRVVEYWERILHNFYCFYHFLFFSYFYENYEHGKNDTLNNDTMDKSHRRNNYEQMWLSWNEYLNLKQILPSILNNQNFQLCLNLNSLKTDQFYSVVWVHAKYTDMKLSN